MNKYFSFDGLTTRSDYWATLIIIFLASVVFGFIGGFSSTRGELTDNSALVFSGLLTMFIGLVACGFANLALVARRCRDAGLSPWWTLVMIIPYVSIVASIVFGCIPTENK